MKPDYDVLIIGSGFGGSVSALRLTEKGYRVGVLEAGRRFADEDFAETSWDLHKFLWAPKLGCYGIQRIHPLKNVLILAFMWLLCWMAEGDWPPGVPRRL
ncbi:FAD-dependent oxidoreductase, partial [Mycobacterium avium]